AQSDECPDGTSRSSPAGWQQSPGLRQGLRHRLPGPPGALRAARRPIHRGPRRPGTWGRGCDKRQPRPQVGAAPRRARRQRLSAARRGPPVLNSIIQWSLSNRLLVIVVTLVFVVLGGFALTRLDIDAFPDVTPVQVQINTVAPSLAPEEVEQ